jgi:hypothetical protein
MPKVLMSVKLEPDLMEWVRAQAERAGVDRTSIIVEALGVLRSRRAGDQSARLVQMEPELWMWVEERAKLRKVTPTAWFARMVRDARTRLETQST